MDLVNDWFKINVVMKLFVNQVSTVLTRYCCQLLYLPHVRLSIHRQFTEFTNVFSAAVPTRHTAVLHLDVGELLLARYTQTERYRQTDRHADNTHVTSVDPTVND